MLAGNRCTSHHSFCCILLAICFWMYSSLGDGRSQNVPEQLPQLACIRWLPLKHSKMKIEACIFRMLIPEQNRAPGNPVCINSTENGTCELIRPYHKCAIFQQSSFDFRVSSFEIRLVDFEQLTRCQEYLIYSETQLKPEDEIA